MAGWAPALLDEIRTGVDLVDLIGRYVNLRKAGTNWKGLCPFHAEKTPSFMVNPRKGIFHCFGCGAGGDAFAFVMRQDRLSFPEAVRALARSAGVTLPEPGGAQVGDSGREELYRVMDLAARYYAEALWGPDGARARHYLAERGLDEEVARRFGLGYARDAWDGLLDALRAEGMPPEILETAGLVLRRQSGTGFYDRFRHRLVFAIRDLQGRVVAFGGRAFGDEQPKYLNSPETPLYTKGNLLYALDLARPTIGARNRALLVEGYVDCLMAHQHGFTETVAALGTAFTPAQLGALRRYTGEVVTFFDADAAGERAAARAAELLDPSDAGTAWSVTRAGSFDRGTSFHLRVALLPAGHDPDTFLQAEGGAAFEARIAAARSLLSYALERAITDPEGATGPRARANAFARAALLLAKVSDAEEATVLAREAALKLGVDAAQLWIEAQKLQASLRRPTVAAASPAPAAPSGVERDLAALLLRSVPARTQLLDLLEDDDLGHPAIRSIVTVLRARRDAPAESLMPDLPDDAARGTLAALLVDDREAGELEASIDQFRRRLGQRQRLRRLRALARDVVEAQASGTVEAIDEALRTLDREGREAHEHARSSRA